MIGVDRIEDIRSRARGGEPIASIARAVGVSEPTARKCARMEDLSPEPPKRKGPESELLAPHRETTGSWPRERDRRDAEGFMQLSWLPGEIQAGIGEADFRVRGVTTRGKYLTVTFPHSNVGLTQVFWGEKGNTFWSGRASPCGKRGRV